MAIIKCKMCGGDLEVVAESRVAVCEYCGTQQTVPSADNEKKLTLFGRANRLRMACEFDKAAGVYESIVVDFPEEAEAYWGLVLCKYGIEYVDDLATGKKIPTCHRSSFDSVMDDPNLEQALENADAIARRVYRDEAKAIEELRKGIIEVSGKEAPYDIFICYKETDDSGDRTIDSVIALEVYDALTEKGYRVFFSRITLEDKLGQEYEPYIFAALHSAKIMLAFGTDYEYYNAVWVKNEWSRFLQLIAAGEKKTLIPCYKNIDAYDMPKEFARLQAQDMGKVGAMQDLLRGIEKILPREKQVVKETVVVQQSPQNSNTAPLLKRAFMFLEDEEWERADDFCEQVLNIDPECAEAYLGKLMAELEICERAELKDCDEPFDEYSSYQKALRFGDKALREELEGYIVYIENRNHENAYSAVVAKMNNASTEEEYKQTAALFGNFGDYKDAKQLVNVCYEKAEIARKDAIYNHAKRDMQRENDQWKLKTTASLFESIGEYKDAAVLAKECREKAEAVRKDAILAEASAHMQSGSLEQYQAAVKHLETIPGWRDADERLARCQRVIPQLEEKERANAEARRLERERQEEAARQEAARRAVQKKRTQIISAIIAVAVVVAIAAFLVVTKVVIPNGQYEDAVALMESGQYEQAIAAFSAMGGYKDSSDLILEAKYKAAVVLMDTDVVQAYEALIALDGYEDSTEKAKSVYDQYTLEKLKAANIGDYVYFGSCEQDNDTSNGKEDIEWLVLEKTGEKMLVISKNGIESQVYDDINIFDKSYEGSTWETCSLRKWLNSSFINSVFSNAERDRIPSVVVSADKNPEYSSNPGNSVEDRVFILSIMEAKKYFNSNDGRRSVPTEYARQQGSLTGCTDEEFMWWLRTPGESQLFVAYVNSAGKIVTSGEGASRGDAFEWINGNFVGIECMVRPAMWIDLSE